MLPLINPYPITEYQPDMSHPITAYVWKDRVPETCNTARNLAIKMAENHVNSPLPSALHTALDLSNEYSIAKKSMKPLGRMPNVNTYRNRHPAYDPIALDSELRTYGDFLHPQQVIFHGGLCPSSDILGTPYGQQAPLSTTLCPQVAATHGHYHSPNGAIWIFTVSENPITPVYVFNNKGNQRLKHEMEILFASSHIIQVTCITRTNGLSIVDAIIT
ncbi:hypothetical protein [Elstera cyanobacteriorum]|uniref:hypothetical protein n=1 Tax=Elstera cyanobacteriorum TaxID=2022747 RepID=UPI002357141B|nr:hypothetical protein [Elstera cyanobacteriorum]MCK6419256.1 hypothetical protein [Alphaproteobacteria bacterium]MCK6442011.1 hypothetical protein [Elstera cyanobacteriorum]